MIELLPANHLQDYFALKLMILYIYIYIWMGVATLGMVSEQLFQSLVNTCLLGVCS